MKPLTNAEKAELKKLIDAGGQLPDRWMSRLFPCGVATQATQDAIGKEYRLVCNLALNANADLTKRKLGLSCARAGANRGNDFTSTSFRE